MKKILIVIGLILVIIFALRLLTPEDTWIYQNGTWVKHGNPSSPQPTVLPGI
jgi:hypothetical protein